MGGQNQARELGPEGDQVPVPELPNEEPQEPPGHEQREEAEREHLPSQTE